MSSITEEEKNILQHMLGADSRYKKKQWGFRNHFVSSPDCDGFQTLKIMEEKGLVKSGSKFNSTVFWATKDGAVAIGFKKYQLSKTELAAN